MDQVTSLFQQQEGLKEAGPPPPGNLRRLRGTGEPRMKGTPRGAGWGRLGSQWGSILSRTTRLGRGSLGVGWT